MKIAVLISGQPRTIDRAWGNIERNLLVPLSTYAAVDLFGVFPVESPFLSRIRWKDRLVVADTVFPRAMVDKMSSRTRNPAAKINGLLNMWLMWKRADELEQGAEKAGGAPYDWVFRARPDSWFDGPIDDLRALDARNVYIPDHDNWGGVNDRFGFSSSRNMSIYSSIIDTCEQIFDSGLRFHVETFLSHHLKKNGLPVARPKITIRLLRDDHLAPLTFN